MLKRVSMAAVAAAILFVSPAYAALKQRYDPEGRTPTLFDKVAIAG